MARNQYKYFIGIDPGTKTGLAAKSGGKLKVVEGHTILTAMERVKELAQDLPKDELLIVVEDPNKRKWFSGSEEEVQAKRQGVGSVKRDVSVWKEFLERQGLNFEMVHPIKNGTKLKSGVFKSITGWTGRTKEHSRDASMLIFGR
jgi:predicted RNase H-like nuclease (RuvC/YqgF family)